MNLFYLPHAGGSSTSSRDLALHLDGSIRLRPLELPGRGKRLHESLLHDFVSVVDDYDRQIIPWLHGPYAIYGHSMGAMAAFLLVHRLAVAGRPLPRHLFISGRRSPAPPDSAFSRLARDCFLDKVIGLGGTPPSIAGHRELLDFLEPILRADFTAVEAHRDILPPVDVPLTVLTGRDEGMSPEDVRLWRSVARRAITFHQFSGGHFFVLDHWPAIGRLISEVLGIGTEAVSDESFCA